MRVTALVVSAALCASALALAQDKPEKKAAPPTMKAMSPAKAAPSDAQLIKVAMSAAPAAISKDATIVVMTADMKSTRTLRKGTNGYTCMPEPDVMCADQNAMTWFDAYVNKKDPPKDQIGFIYMLAGDRGASNSDPYAEKETPTNNWVKTGPHLMVVGVKGMVSDVPHDAKADSTKAFVMWPGTRYEHLMLPVK